MHYISPSITQVPPTFMVLPQRCRSSSILSPCWPRWINWVRGCTLVSILECSILASVRLLFQWPTPQLPGHIALVYPIWRKDAPSHQLAFSLGFLCVIPSLLPQLPFPYAPHFALLIAATHYSYAPWIGPSTSSPTAPPMSLSSWVCCHNE